ncbi:MAG: four helix bundle protein [Vicingaceae bacterium]
MFDFQDLHVYKKSLDFNRRVESILRRPSIDPNFRNQLKRAAFSILLNIAEGTGRFTKADRKHFYVMARASVYECVAVMDYFKLMKLVNEDQIDLYMNSLEEISKMLFSLIKTTLGRD